MSDLAHHPSDQEIEHTSTSPPAHELANPKKPWYKRRRNIAIILALLLLIIITAPAKHKKVSNNTTPSANNSSSENLSGITSRAPAAASNLTGNEKSYFNTVWGRLNTIGNLAGQMNQNCNYGTFPPPGTCASAIQTYRQELLKSQSDLEQLSAPTSFAPADSTLRKALGEDLQATSQALQAIQDNKLKEWISALTLHGQAGRDLNQAGSQALSVLQ
jgi:hypothetical protein